ncbi:outer membrane beta-barrel protein [Aliikangiella maris]|uniref:Outer membrane beta-barrel protein n=2 Tax=Aliikangiella maris TaxID=3162458 RepID=A0ABV2BZP2_9GAMM
MAEVNQLNYRENWIDVKPLTVSIGANYQFNSYFSLLGKLSTGVQEDSATHLLQEYDFKVCYSGGIYAKASLLKDTLVTPYLYLGYSQVHLRASAENISANQKENDWSYGAGLEFRLAKSFKLAIDYTQIIDNSDAELTSSSVIASFQF